MKRKTLAVGAATLAALVTVGACSNTSTTQGASSSSVSAPSSTSATEAHNQADAMFAQHMIPHHQQAIEMSDMLLGKQGIDPRVLDLAKQIKAAQGPEIEQMQGWLTQWGMSTMPMMPGMDDMPGHGGMPSASAAPSESGAPTQSMMPGMPGMSDMPGMPGMGDMPGMEGMMSEEDMAALQNAQGVEASKLYLTQMVKHHEGAITMAQNEIKDGQFPDTVALARSIVTSQQQEIDTMNKILASL
ncbi:MULTISPECIES: DUF305 domain-containing protein [Mycolicibacterium]|uniref:DUF305 domain-containing protein n=1 Tax=Mycolicibacterium vanbaalenii (strain DSM 7251 / JCM 13017 / BCRC 16820 / KCTC 9966 / NRRL B-24157 / PYR-1) TaxID=350058 RepID=A1TBB3_MYCVP|nr:MULTISPECIES: DUF305 domain-containing protein [Mycolicibacterium]ABM14463.1 protein of unknown function DUF305 [Mycolicibacterium vanbaalenii PYR-1]MCV7131312.1 DUF305 domain-containing protein [Mycolicibacterium vanbaalenii PYR-1]QZY44324.1 DUF305 domain-containing protein [Mycolicibacterium austroafricanum]